MLRFPLFIKELIVKDLRFSATKLYFLLEMSLLDFKLYILNLNFESA